MNVNRRTVVGGIVAAGGTLTLAACAAEPDPVESTPPSATVETEPAEAPNTAAGILLGLAADVMVGSGKKFMVDETLTVLVTQPSAGDYRGFSATCTHAGCIVNGVEDGQIACGCHGARFNVETGAVEAGPARSALGRITIEVRGEELFAQI
jgi:Rieske Fe-S protein